METGGMELEIIINPKTTDDGQAVIQVRFLLQTDRIAITNLDLSSKPPQEQPSSTSGMHTELMSLVPAFSP